MREGAAQPVQYRYRSPTPGPACTRGKPRQAGHSTALLLGALRWRPTLPMRSVTVPNPSALRSWYDSDSEPITPAFLECLRPMAAAPAQARAGGGLSGGRRRRQAGSGCGPGACPAASVACVAHLCGCGRGGEPAEWRLCAGGCRNGLCWWRRATGTTCDAWQRAGSGRTGAGRGNVHSLHVETMLLPGAPLALHQSTSHSVDTPKAIGSLPCQAQPLQQPFLLELNSCGLLQPLQPSPCPVQALGRSPGDCAFAPAVRRLSQCRQCSRHRCRLTAPPAPDCHMHPLLPLPPTGPCWLGAWSYSARHRRS